MEQQLSSNQTNPTDPTLVDTQRFQKKQNKSGKKILIILILIAIISAAAYYFFFLNNNAEPVAPENNSKVSENENKIDKNADTDDDGLPDYMEKVIGTDSNNPDTDGDGYSDFDEIKNGYDPLSDKKYTEEEWMAVKDKIKAADAGFFEKEFGNTIVNSNGEVKPAAFVCGASTVSDIDGNIYKTVKIGEQCWLKENLKVTKNPAGEAITRYCYDNDPKICDTDGGLYNWNTTMNNSTIEGAQGICPSGTHIPTDAEQYTLENYLKDGANSCVSTRTGWDCDTAGTKLKVGGASGFEGILAGYRNTGGSFNNRLTTTDFWSSSQYDASDAWRRYLNSGNSAVNRYNFYAKAYGFSVRCLKD